MSAPRTSSRHLFKFAACACLVAAGGHGASAQEAEKRDLSRYERGCELALRRWYGTAVDDEEGAKARVRQLLWERWRAKRPGYCAITVSYTHGEGETTRYYVEPDSEGRWRVAVEVESSGGLHEAMRGDDTSPKTRVLGAYYSVSRVDAESGRPVPESERRRPETYALLFQDRKPAAKDEMGSPSLKL